MNAIEKALMNNPVRAGLQRHYEAGILERLGGRLDGGRALEIGGGRGVGVEVILDRFGAADVVAFDLDPGMVRRARTRLRRLRAQATDAVGDATAIAEPDASFDAVFDFGIGPSRFYFEEVTRHALDRWSYRTFLDHPSDDRFSADELVAELERQGLSVGGRWVTSFLGDFVIGIAVADPA